MNKTLGISAHLLFPRRLGARPRLVLIVARDYCSKTAATSSGAGPMIFQRLSSKIATDTNSNLAAAAAAQLASPTLTARLTSPLNGIGNGNGEQSIAKEPDPIASVSSGSGMKTAKQLIYCEGSLLHSVQMARLFADCKHFVDMPLRSSAEETLCKWQALETSGPLDATQIAAFVAEHFDEPEGELVQCEPIDWTPDLTFDHILDPEYRVLAHRLHLKWPSLYRRVSDRVLLNPERFSIIPVPNPFVVPGGRFREMYYWDSFFTIKGLLASQMLNTVKGMIENMQYLAEMYGFIPNGNRLYYLNRSQPPLLTWCVHEYFKATHDLEFVTKLLPTLRKELVFFQTNRSVMLEGWHGPLFRFVVNAFTPRPESYREDMESAHHLPTVEEKRILWGDIAAAAESGRDFSSRWFAKDGPFAGHLKSTRTSQIVPVELNAIICGNLRMMGDLYDAIGDIDGSKWCAIMHDTMRRTIHQVLWNESHGCWFDFDLSTATQVEDYVDTNFFPMAMNAVHEEFDSNRVATYIKKKGLLEFEGGLPTSLNQSGEQWDFPNSWAPTSWITITGLEKCGQKELALHLADKWVRKNYNMWRYSGGKMFEKYNVSSSCFKQSYGGEYEVQEGFGWSNGVILDLLMSYGNRLTCTINKPCECCDETKNCPNYVAN